jgi:hypothetical protein
VLEVFLKLSHTWHFTGPFIFRIISSPPSPRFQFTLIWIFARCILYPLFHFVREPHSSTGELGESQISHEDMLVVSNAFRKFLTPTRTSHMNTKLADYSSSPELSFRLGNFRVRHDFSRNSRIIPYVFQMLAERREETRQLPLMEFFSRSVGHSASWSFGQSVGWSFGQSLGLSVGLSFGQSVCWSFG